METRPLNWGAIAAGWAVRTLVGGLFGGIVGGIIGASNAASMMSQMSKMPRPGTPGAPVDAQQMATQIQSIIASPALLISGLVISTIFTVIGGFVAGRMAGHAEVKHAGIMGAISLALSLLLSLPALLSPIRFAPLGFTIVPLVLAVPMAILGGLIAEKLRKPEAAVSASPGAFDPIPRI